MPSTKTVDTTKQSIDIIELYIENARSAAVTLRKLKASTEMANHSSDVINSLVAKFGLNKQTTNPSVIRELTKQFIRTLEALKQKDVENTNRHTKTISNKMNELFEDENKFYPNERLETLSADILRILADELTQADVATEVVPIESYRQSLDTYVRDRYRNYREINRLRADNDRTAMDVVSRNLTYLYEHALSDWIQLTDTVDRRLYMDESRLLRTRIVSENMPIYRHRLDLMDLNNMFDQTEREMLDVFDETVIHRHVMLNHLLDRVIEWYNREMEQEYDNRYSINKIKDQNFRNTPTIPSIGIDLGTTNSSVAYYRLSDTGQSSRIVVCINSNSNNNNDVTPSCVEYKTNGDVVVGEEARNNLLGNFRNIIHSAKRMIGRLFNDSEVTRYRQYWPFDVVNIDGNAGVEVDVNGELRQLLAEEVSADVLRKIKEVAEKDIGCPVIDAVITVPAYFTDAQREATRGAGIMAGLNVLSIIDEPTAAALAYKLDRFDRMGTRTVLIYDFGGGTFDVGILRFSMGKVTVLAVGGDNSLGGDDIDQNIIDHCLREFYAQTGVMLDRNSVEGDRAYRVLKHRCEREKWRLSATTAATIAVDNIADGHYLKVELTRIKFEELNKELFDRSMECVTQTLESVNNGKGMSPDEIDDIVLVGGSTYIPYVQNMIKDYFNGRQPSQSVNPMLAVAQGAALQAAILNGNAAHLGHYNRLLEVTPYTIGIKEKGDVMRPIIPAHSPVDGISRIRIYKTVCDNQTEIEVEVFEGEDPIATNNTFLGRFVVIGIPPDNAGKQNVLLEFCVNDDGNLKVKAVVLSQGTVTEHEVRKYKGRLSMDEVLRRRWF
ncbi:unnamed protein product [Medioppia subpectinata]|uniref:Heat shock protein 70 n=1 Tax=Medioppia subpectinata TaxID=1979941 RepID=A0A7R9KQY2_9ACAR|nr:unnamed protein product [Medioppia subpectinata]CAG2107059.1 unnamed protein product [Medioppia subpectinata]